MIITPYDIHVRGGKHCVMKRGTKSPRPGRCHDTRAEAIKQQRALYAAEGASVTSTEYLKMMNSQATPAEKLWWWLGPNYNAAQEVTGMSTDMTVTFTDGSGQVIRFAPVTDAEDGQVAWEGILAVVGYPTSDKRYLIPNEITNRDLPLVLSVQTKIGEGHLGAEGAGSIQSIDYIPKSEFDAEGFSLSDVPDAATIVFAKGLLDGSEHAADAERMITNGAGVSLDLPPTRLALFDPETLQEVPEDQVDMMDVLSGKYLIGIGGKIGGATIVGIPAFEDARITITPDGAMVASAYGLRVDRQGWVSDKIELDFSEEAREAREALVASAAPLKPPAEWFQNPNLTKLTPLTITKEGRIYGHLADWDGCHTGFSSICVPPFRSQSNYAYFNIAPVETADGELIKTGKLMFSRDGVGHAPTEQWTTAEDASKHYDDATKDAGYVMAGADRFGTWLAGALVPGLTEEDVQYIRSHPPSGDWRPSPKWAGSELIAAFCVSVPGFPIAQSLVASASDGGLTIITAPLNLELGPRAKTRQIAMLKARLHALVAKGETATPDDMIWMTADDLEGEFAPTAEQRRAWAKSGVALDDGSFPITKCTGDGTSAINARRAIGRAPESKRESVRRHISKREKALGCSNE